MDGVRSGITRPAGRRVRRSPRRALALAAPPGAPAPSQPYRGRRSQSAWRHTSTTGQAASSLPIVPVATVSARPMVLTLAGICL